MGVQYKQTTAKHTPKPISATTKTINNRTPKARSNQLLWAFTFSNKVTFGKYLAVAYLFTSFLYEIPMFGIVTQGEWIWIFFGMIMSS